jgi:hypothetical protein
MTAKTKAKRPQGRPRNAKIDAAAAQLGVTPRQARNILSEIQLTGNSAEDMAQARLREKVLRGEKLAYELEVAKGKHISRDKIEEEIVALGSSVKAQLLAWVGALPGRLEGLTAAQMVPIFEAEVDRVLRSFSDLKL